MEDSKNTLLPGGMVVRNYTVAVPGVRKKILYHFSDSHLSLFDELSTLEEQKRALEGTAGWEAGRESFARRYHQPCADAQKISAEDHFRNLVHYASMDGDGIILCGDIFDYVSGANVRFFEKEIAGLSMPFLAVCGNHESDGEIPAKNLFARVREPVQVLDMGDLILAGFDNSRRQITPAQNNKLREILDMGKPVVVAMHIPIMTEGNWKRLLECGDYFRLNHMEADAATLEFVEILKENASKITAVLAGHLHFPNDSEIAPGLPQFISSQGVLGCINRYEIGGDLP